MKKAKEKKPAIAKKGVKGKKKITPSKGKKINAGVGAMINGVWDPDSFTPTLGDTTFGDSTGGTNYVWTLDSGN